MDRFITLQDLLDYNMLILIVFTFVQFTKEIKYIKSIPTKYYSWMVAFVLITVGNFYAGTFTYWELVVYPLSAIFVSLGTNGLADVNRKKGESIGKK